MAYFEEGSEAMIQLESMVDRVGIKNVLWALSHICGAKAEHLAHLWQDVSGAKVWDQWASALDKAAAAKRYDPLGVTNL